MALRKLIVKVDSPEAKQIEEEIKTNGGFCPCRMIQNDDTKCMCKDFRETIKKVIPLNNVATLCHCGLYALVGVEDGQS